MKQNLGQLDRNTRIIVETGRPWTSPFVIMTNGTERAIPNAKKG